MSFVYLVIYSNCENVNKEYNHYVMEITKMVVILTFFLLSNNITKNIFILAGNILLCNLYQDFIMQPSYIFYFRRMFGLPCCWVSYIQYILGQIIFIHFRFFLCMVKWPMQTTLCNQHKKVEENVTKLVHGSLVH